MWERTSEVEPPQSQLGRKGPPHRVCSSLPTQPTCLGSAWLRAPCSAVSPPSTSHPPPAPSLLPGPCGSPARLDVGAPVSKSLPHGSGRRRGHQPAGSSPRCRLPSRGCTSRRGPPLLRCREQGAVSLTMQGKRGKAAPATCPRRWAKGNPRNRPEEPRTSAGRAMGTDQQGRVNMKVPVPRVL